MRGQDFLLQMPLKGNGYSIPKDAPNQWVYVAWGADLDKQRAGCVVRDMDGNVLGRNMNFAWEGGHPGDATKEGQWQALAAAVRRCAGDGYGRPPPDGG